MNIAAIKTNNYSLIKPLKTYLIKLLLAISLGIIFIAGFILLPANISVFAIRNVKIVGDLARTSKQDIWQATIDLIKNGFFATNVSAIKLNLQKLPWIASVKVEKNWPDNLIIYLTEKAPIARWRGKGFLTQDGEIIYSRHAKDLANSPDLLKLPIFWGKEQQIAAMLNSYNTILQTLQQSAITIQELEIMPDYGLKTILSNGIMLFLGQEGLRDRLNRFNLAYLNRFAANAEQIEYIDLRYVNGIAIGWKKKLGKTTTKKYDHEVNILNA